MEQTTQQINQGSSLPIKIRIAPIKTRVAALWMMIMGISQIPVIILFSSMASYEFVALVFFGFISFLGLGVLILVIRKRWVWRLIIGFLFITLIFALLLSISLLLFEFKSPVADMPFMESISYSSAAFIPCAGFCILNLGGWDFAALSPLFPQGMFICPFFSSLLPFILLLLDRKNFWKIAK